VIIFSFFDIKILEKFNQKIEKLVKVTLEKQKKLNFFLISLLKNSEISPEKERGKLLIVQLRLLAWVALRAGNEPPLGMGLPSVNPLSYMVKWGRFFKNK
jgi:hypothetical protein